MHFTSWFEVQNMDSPYQPPYFSYNASFVNLVFSQDKLSRVKAKNWFFRSLWYKHIQKE